MAIENWLLGVICALIGAAAGGYFGHSFTVRLFDLKAKSQKSALYSEFEIIEEEFARHIKSLVNDFKSNLKDSYAALPEIDLTLATSLIVELAGSTELPSKEQRKLIKNLTRVNTNLINKQIKRDKVLTDLFTNKDNISGHEHSKILMDLRFHTSQLLVEAIQIVFYASKFHNEKSNFIFGEYSYFDYAETTCRICNLDYDHNLWSRIIKMSIPDWLSK